MYSENIEIIANHKDYQTYCEHFEQEELKSLKTEVEGNLKKLSR